MNSQKPFRQCSNFRFARLGRRVLHSAAVLLIAWLAAVSALAQASQSALGARLQVVPPAASVPLNQETMIEIRFLDARGNHVPATANLSVTLTASMSGDLIAARRSVSPQSVQSLQYATIFLAKSAEHVAIRGNFPAGWKSVWVKFRSERGGAVRLFAEGAGMLTGSGAINIQGPSRIAVKLNSPAGALRKDAAITISLLDYSGREVAATDDFTLTVTATTLGGLSDTRNAANMARLPVFQQSKSLDGQSLALTKSSTAKLTGIFPKNAKQATLRFRSDLPGTVRIFVEGVGLSTGFAPVSIAWQIQDDWPSPKPAWGVVPAFFTVQPVTMTPALWQPCMPQATRLEIKLVDESARSDYNAFFVTLVDLAGKSVVAQCDIPISLELADESRKSIQLEQTQIVIHNGGSFSPVVQMMSKCSEQVRLTARTKVDGVSSGSKTIPFKPQRRAAKLMLSPSPHRAVANGLTPIFLTVTTSDSCGSAISPKDEGQEDARAVVFDFPHSLRFDGEQPALAIAADKSSGTIKVYSSRPVWDMKIVARSSNALGEWIESNGEDSKVSFNFPALELLCAALGGCLIPLLSFGKKRNWAGVAKGALSGVATFGAALFGAIATGTMTSMGGLVVQLTSFPTDNVFGAALVGLFGYGLVTGAGAIKTMANKSVPAGAESGAGS